MKKRISSYLLVVSICTFFAIFFFIVQNSYDNLMKPVEETKASAIIKPINPDLDVTVLDQIEKRKFYEPFADVATPTPLPIATTTPVNNESP